MAIRVRYSYTDYKQFSGATQASKIHSLSAMAIPLVAIFLFALLSSYNVNTTISIVGPIVFCVLCYAVSWGRYDHDIINGVFLGINGVSNEQRKKLVNRFMSGKQFGKGDISSACKVATVLKGLDLDYRNKRISLGEYCEKRHAVLSHFGIEDVGGLE